MTQRHRTPWGGFLLPSLPRQQLGGLHPTTLDARLQYHAEARRTSKTLWWKPTKPPKIARGLSESSCKVSDLISRRLLEVERRIKREPLRAAFAHVVTSVAGLASQRDDRGWVQVSISYVTQGTGVSPATARHALKLVQDSLLCVRTRSGWLTTTPEAVRGAWKASAAMDSPEPLIGSCVPSEAFLAIPRGSDRGATQCPCGEHSRGDRSPSLAYDLKTGLATCQVSRAVFRLDHDGGWIMVRAPGSWKKAEPAKSRNKISPEGSRALPWRRVRHAPGQGLCVTRHPDHVSRGQTQSSFTDSMSWSASRYGGKAEEEAAHVAAACRSSRPDRWICLDRVWLDRDASVWGETVDGRQYPRTSVYKSAGTDLVLLDLDGLDPRGTDLDEEALRIILQAVHGAQDLKPVSVVATSRTGLQIVCRVPEWAPDSQALHRFLPLRRTLQKTASRILARLNRGGKVDRSAWASMRNARRPGWRVKDGAAVLARLWWVSQS